jgi:hypothetical protein
MSGFVRWWTWSVTLKPFTTKTFIGNVRLTEHFFVADILRETCNKKELQILFKFTTK